VILEMDALDHALATILLTVSGEVYPITFHSRTFSPAEHNYDIYSKELLAIVEVFRNWYHYLEETLTPVKVFTNYKNLIYFSDSKTLSIRGLY